jgi:hypothetical protein
VARFLEHFLQVGYAGKDRRDLLEMQIRLLRQEAVAMDRCLGCSTGRTDEGCR